MDVYSASYVAAHLGVTVTALNNWVNEKPEGFILPYVTVRGLGSKISVRAWTYDQLIGLRDWMAERLNMSRERAEKYWDDLDARLNEEGRMRRDKVSEGQLLLGIPAQHILKG